jgi:hypothetical protein
MTEYAFDVKLWAVARVTADNVKEAREKLRNVADCMDMRLVTPDGVRFTEASSEGAYDLIEIDGEAADCEHNIWQFDEAYGEFRCERCGEVKP